MASKGSQHVTAADIRQHFQSAGIKLSTATIYRHLGRMLKEGLVARYTIDGNQGYCYEFLGGTHAQHKTSCFHCKCEHCGILIHLACHEIEALSAHLNQSHHFSLDPARTIFYGRCNRCALDHMAPLIGQGCHHG
ncbi:MAG: transcriptional repressor [Oxalobacter sp.]|nr:transcriptional repressor [Oxalobacter sp.]